MRVFVAETLSALKRAVHSIARHSASDSQQKAALHASEIAFRPLAYALPFEREVILVAGEIVLVPKLCLGTHLFEKLCFEVFMQPAKQSFHSFPNSVWERTCPLVPKLCLGTHLFEKLRFEVFMQPAKQSFVGTCVPKLCLGTRTTISFRFFHSRFQIEFGDE